MTQNAATKLGNKVRVPVLLGLAVVSCTLQLIGLYRPGSPPSPDPIPHLDKIGHVVIFALPVLLILLTRAAVTGARPGIRFGAVVITIFVGHAVLSEVLQANLLAQRSGDPYDIVADLVGIAIGYGTAVPIINRRSRR